MKYCKLVDLYEYLEQTPARLEKTAAIADFIRDADSKELEKVTLLVQGKVFPFIKNIRENMDRVRIRVKEDFNLASGEFLQFLEKAYKAFPK